MEMEMHDGGIQGGGNQWYRATPEEDCKLGGHPKQVKPRGNCCQQQTGENKKFFFIGF